MFIKRLKEYLFTKLLYLVFSLLTLLFLTECLLAKHWVSIKHQHMFAYRKTVTQIRVFGALETIFLFFWWFR